jgi:hypothetical protein
MIEYRVRRIDGDDTDGMQKVCNDLAKDGWRLVSTSAVAVDALKMSMFTFCAWETSAEDIARAARQFAPTATP